LKGLLRQPPHPPKPFWRARQNGLQDQAEASEVRNLNHDAEARAQAEAAMQQMMTKAKGTRRTR
jgi:hypothetical protein